MNFSEIKTSNKFLTVSISLIVLLLSMSACQTAHFDTVANLSFTDSDHREQYSPYYLDYKNGRMNIIYRIHPISAENKTEKSTPEAEQTIDYYVFFNDDLVSERDNVISYNEKYYLWALARPNTKGWEKYGEVLGDNLPQWILDQFSMEQLATYESAKEGNSEAQKKLAILFKTLPHAPFGSGCKALEEYWTRRSN